MGICLDYTLFKHFLNTIICLFEFILHIFKHLFVNLFTSIQIGLILYTYSKLSKGDFK